MVRLPVNVYEMFHARFRCGAGQAAIAQVLHKARIVRGKAPELGPGHSGFAQELLDPAYQHDRFSIAVRGVDPANRCWE
jgi:hypothetical protein